MVYQTGQIMPVKAICELAHQQDIEVLVDGAHAFAHLSDKHEDIQGDYYATSLHKWLMAPKGTGMLYIQKNKIGQIEPLMSGPSSRPERNTRISKYESVGTVSLAPFMAIGEAIAIHLAIGPKRKEERLRYLTNYWAEGLRSIPKVHFFTTLGSSMSCGIASFGIDGFSPDQLRDYLWHEHRIQTAAIWWRDTIHGLRISPNLYTTLPELDRFCEVIEHVAQNGLPKPYSDYRYSPWD